MKLNKSIRYAAVPALTLAGILVYWTWLAWLIPTDNTLEVLGERVKVPWHSESDGRSNHALLFLVSDFAVTNVPSIQIGEQEWMVDFRSDTGGRQRIADTALLGKSLRNLWGHEMMRWDCSVEGSLAHDFTEPYLSVNLAGHAQAEGAVVIVRGQMDDDSHFTMRITERPWGKSARVCYLKFQINSDRKIAYLGPADPSDWTGGLPPYPGLEGVIVL